MQKRLYRSRTDRMIWGVCGGLANYLNIDPVLIRIITVLLIFANGLGILAYIIMAIVVPLEPIGESKATTPKETIRENVEEMKEAAQELGREIRATFAEEKVDWEQVGRSRQRRLTAVGIILLVVGALFLLATFNFFWWFTWSRLWPLILIVIGALVIISVMRRR